MHRAVSAAIVLVLRASGAAGQDSVPAPMDPLAPVASMGLPRPIRWYGGAGTGLELRGDASRVLARGMFGGSRDLTNAIPGLVAVGAEVWLGMGGAGADAGGRLLLANNAAGIQGGVDYSLRLGRADAVLTAQQPLRRGGIVLAGAGLRLDWIPARSSLTATLSVPLFQQHPGRTRPRRADVVPEPVPIYRAAGRTAGDPLLDAALVRLREAAMGAASVTVPFVPSGDPERSTREAARLRAYLERLPPDSARTPAARAVHRYHEALQEAFRLARGDEAGDIAAAARRILLDEVLIPYDRDLGRIRRPAVLRALRARAAVSFAAWAGARATLPETRRPAVVGVYERLLAIVQEVADTSLEHWGDSRLVWLPLQYALEPEQHDTQSELDTLIERITTAPFERGNDIVYATDERFHVALQRTIREARDYHVLWVHDFAGRSPRGGPDTVALRVVESYLGALTSAADAFDLTGRVPVFLLFLDRYYYGRSRSAVWLPLLENPLGREFSLPGKYRGVETAVRDAQERLRAAVGRSPALQAEARTRGERWLERLFSVHVSTTNPPDPSFRGPRGAGVAVAGPTDDMMRDHRKMAFADITERDPERGWAMLTGLGVGEHYARFRWLDRTLLLRGPAAVALKREARELLLSQGFHRDDIPAVLRAAPAPADLAERVAALERLGWSARAAIAVNATGHGPKHATAAKAALYTLLPAGCTIVAADPQWLSRFWAGALLGSALRGCRVLLIGPGPRNAPFSTSFVQATLQRDLFLRILESRRILEHQLRASGGRVEIGLFRVGLGTYNVPGGVRGVRDGLRQYPFLREVLPFDRSVWELFEQADSLLEALGHDGPVDSSSRYHPRFHLKTQFLASGEALREVLGRPEWRSFFARRIDERLHESPAGTDIALRHLDPLRRFLDGRGAGARERQVLYLELGSHNQDPRSFMLDGEALCLVAGESALVAGGDMLLLAAVGTDWLATRADLDRHFPPHGPAAVEASRAAEPLF